MNPVNGYFPMAPRPDVCYMLIGLFADRGNYCNGALFAPDSYTDDLLDYRQVLNLHFLYRFLRKETLSFIFDDQHKICR